MPDTDKLNIAYVIAEAAPFFKTGGLGDVGGSFPAAIKRDDVNIKVFLPEYSCLDERYRQSLQHICDFSLRLAWRNLYCGLQHLHYNGVDWYFIDNEYYFKRDRLYGYSDDAERMAFFCTAVLQCLKRLDFSPDIIHCNDWHSSLIPILLKEYYNDDSFFYSTHTVLTIHNLQYQGIFPAAVIEDVLGLASDSQMTNDLQWGAGINYLKGGILTADCLTTVSPSYAQEICCEAYGEGLHQIINWRKGRLFGIVNGLDYACYDPANDAALCAAYSSEHPEGKLNNKLALQAELGLAQDASAPLMAMVTRLADQKGLDLLTGVIGQMLTASNDECSAGKLQFVVLGTGKPYYEEMLSGFKKCYSQQMAVCLTFDDCLARRIYAGADMLLMPSRFEPCGLSQLISMAYGTVPLVRHTGGLRDTVQPFDVKSGEGCGFIFEQYSEKSLLNMVRQATDVFLNNTQAWLKVRQNAFAADFSWQKSAEKYLQLFAQLKKSRL